MWSSGMRCAVANRLSWRGSLDERVGIPKPGLMPMSVRHSGYDRKGRIPVEDGHVLPDGRFEFPLRGFPMRPGKLQPIEARRRYNKCGGATLAATFHDPSSLPQGLEDANERRSLHTHLLGKSRDSQPRHLSQKRKNGELRGRHVDSRQVALIETGQLPRATAPGETIAVIGTVFCHRTVLGNVAHAHLVTQPWPGR